MGDPRIDEAIAAGDVPSDVPIHLLRESRDTSAIAGIVVVLVLTTLVVVLRLYSRKYITKKGALGIDDGIALASLLVFIPFTALCIELLVLGAGRNFLFECISLFCDLLLFGIPGIMLKGLELPRKQKLQLAYTLFPGILVIGISAGRIVIVTKYGYETDETFEYAFLNLLCVEVAEVGATIIAVSIPGVKPLVDKYILLKDRDSSSSSAKSRGTSISSTEEIKQHRGHVDIMEFSEEKFGRWSRRQTEGGTA
ncbi:hypothetical protein MHUMG1_10398 [Metarhizium humberi]|uniref:Rhodopsin domain-containing protein n=1 Tax=Metarhizium humberi TaxID=2596975 RepID=A0A9P8S2S0_9HYPO|nr:hypothetical protein MHUMG1_10398 [Metarhizium humberi]